jgi:bifunctional DNase/RNase
VPENEQSFILVEIGGVVRDPKENPVVLLKAVERDEVLPIWIGHAEALSIEMKLDGKKFERPLTHDLLKTTLETFGATVVKVVVSDLKNNTFYAKIYLQRDGEIYVFDARPSDSIALALRTQAPIFVSERVFNSHKKVIRDHEMLNEIEDERLRKYLRDLDPGNF